MVCGFAYIYADYMLIARFCLGSMSLRFWTCIFPKSC